MRKSCFIAGRSRREFSQRIVPLLAMLCALAARPAIAHEFWIEFRPDVLKRQRARVRLNSAPGEKPMPLAHVLGYVHLYTILGFEDGIRYEVIFN